MLVDVVPLRRQGERLSNDEAKAAHPARGHLALGTRHAPLRELDRVVV
jgi:hypothetical protein